MFGVAPRFLDAVEGNWFTAGNDWQNGSHGVEVSMSIPSPRKREHCFYQRRTAIYSSHETVIEPENTPLFFRKVLLARSHVMSTSGFCIASR